MTAVSQNRHPPASEEPTAQGVVGLRTQAGSEPDPDRTFGGPAARDIPPGTPHQAFAPGDVVAGCFQIERQLGAGGMGIVYLARHLQLDRLVALKVHRSGSEQDRARLEREAKAMARVAHSSVIGVYDVRMDRGVLFIAMEFIDGLNARDWLADRRHGVKARVEMALAAGGGLAVAHQVGLVHRDFKPENILISRNGRVVVADFGLARSPEAMQAGPYAEPFASGVDVQLTRAGALMGTPAYMAPEQYKPGLVDARADQFALAIVTFEAAYGMRPFAGRAPMELAYQVMQGEVLPMPAGSEAPPQLYEVLLRALQPDPAARFPSVTAFTNAAAATMRAPRKGALVLAVGGFAVLAFLLAVGAYYGYGELEARRELAVLDAVLSTDAVKAQAKAWPKQVAAEADAAARAEKAKASATAAEALKRFRDGPAMSDDPLAALDAMEAIENGASLGSVASAFLKNRRNLAPPEAVQWSRIPWDGKTTLTCGMGQKILLEDVVAEVAEGPAVEATMYCSIRIVNSKIQAETIVAGSMAARVEIEGGVMVPTKHLVDVSMVQSVVIKDVVLADPTKGAALNLGPRTFARIDDSILRGSPAVQVGMRGRVEFFGGRLEGDPVAINAAMHARVSLSSVTVQGETKAGMYAVVDVVKAP